MGLVRGGSTKANVTHWAVNNGPHNSTRISHRDRNLVKELFCEVATYRAWKRGSLISGLDNTQKQNILRRLVGNGSAYEDPSTHTFTFFKSGMVYMDVRSEELCEANPDRFQQRHTSMRLLPQTRRKTFLENRH